MNYHVVIDGNSYLYKAFFGIPNLQTSDGQKTNAIYGFLKMIYKILNKFKLAKLVIVFDGPDNSKQKKMIMKDYKINRPPMPDDLKNQSIILCDIIQLMNIPLFKMPCVEADDVIAKFIYDFKEQYKNSDDIMLIVSSDKDILQYVDEKVKVYNPSDDVIIDENIVQEKWGVKTNQIRDLLALMGDKSDNIPGIPGIGEKTAIKLLAEYGNLQNILQNIDSIKGKIGNIIKENKDIAMISYELVCPNVNIDVNYKDVLNLDLKINDEVLKKMQDLELFSLINEFKKLSLNKSEIDKNQKNDNIYKVGEQIFIDFN